MAAGGSYFGSRLPGYSGSVRDIVGGGGAPPVSTKKADFKSSDKHYALKLNAYNRALRNAAKKRAAAKKKAPLSGPGSFAGINFAAQAPPSQPLINPFPQVLKGVAADTREAKGQVSRGRKEAERALKDLGVGGGGVAGAGVGDIYAGGLSGIDSTSRGIRSGINTEAQKFILQQIQQRQQFQMEQMQRNQITPDTLRQLVASGIDPNSVNLNDPFAVAVALGQAQRSSGGSGGGLSFGQIASLAQAGIDPDLYRDDPYGAAKALGKSKRKTGPSQSDIAALLKAAQ
jgi:hypothetical protein